jgi:hypothetical protein
MSKEKPFIISKWQVMQAYELVKANAGAAGQTLVPSCSANNVLA